MSGFTCATCATHVPVTTYAPWRCPQENGDRHHVLLIDKLDELLIDQDLNPFVAFRRNMMWWQFARSHEMSDERSVAIVRALDQAIAGVAGTGFLFTPLELHHGLGSVIGFDADGEVWVKDETHNVAGSQKARHLLSILLHLLIAEELGLTPWTPGQDRPPLTISSCGNAAIAAATLAAAAHWTIEVFIPEWADGAVLEILNRLGARVNRCPRRSDDPPGDPTVLRFREAVADGAIPFSVQGPENALCLDGGRTIGWEMAQQFATRGVLGLDAVFVQVGGGAFATSVSRGLCESGFWAPLLAVQTAGCAPLARAWETAQLDRDSAQHWSQHMWPWETEPRSLADGILDDETYDWVAIIEQLRRSDGRVVVADEGRVIEAAEVVPRSTQINASPTGTAGAAGLLASRGQFAGDARVAVILSGIRRD